MRYTLKAYISNPQTKGIIMSYKRVILDNEQDLSKKINKFGFTVVPLELEGNGNNNQHKLAYTIGFSNFNAPELIISDYRDEYLLEFLHLVHHQISHSIKLPSQSVIQCADNCFKLLELDPIIQESFKITAKKHSTEKTPGLLDFNMLYVSKADKDGLFEDEKPFTETPSNNMPLYEARPSIRNFELSS
jgi:hypothetical protein